MRSVPDQPPGVELVAEDEQGRVRARSPLPHGADPVDVLHALGWAVVRVRSAQQSPDAHRLLRLRFQVRPVGDVAEREEPPEADLAGGAVPRDADLVLDEGERLVVFQRVAAYAVVESPWGVLMSEASDRTNAPGTWALPGGGIDPGEEPADAVAREVWEESDQQVEVGELLLVQSQHWVGRAPGGRAEDYHAVRLIHRARCSRPSDPVLNDVGGTTRSAAWVPPTELAALPMSDSWRAALVELGLL
ncbi:MAG TPA: NUDIX domain-containing protein [Segeticoccus sp.]|uniref:NUDIX hydrolase n=1 Tax=Segeticoccus sp. TaxID=2706531 RepID=UPI002D8070C6|nr:NUDIX domain-containing protein [Segeticoccus sp.]HET8601936.1 NUDIX domain-containing protein [Segeticoccus sp.]